MNSSDQTAQVSNIDSSSHGGEGEGRMPVDEAFPFPQYREHQEEILRTARKALFEDGKDIVVIDAPTGIGKSGINIALGRMSESAFYTTPQRKLREQLQSDTSLKPYHTTLKARRDYTCDSVPSEHAAEDEEYNCQSCPVNYKDELSCADFECSYWRDKGAAMNDRIATITFAYLIIDGRIPPYTQPVAETGGQSSINGFERSDTGMQVSFDDRELLIIDEAHTLAEQIAGLHAGQTLGPKTLKTRKAKDYFAKRVPGKIEDDVSPYDVFNDALKSQMMKTDTRLGELSVPDIVPVIKATLSAVSDKSNVLDKHPITEQGGYVKSDLESMEWKLSNVISDVEDGRAWVMDTEKLNTGRYEVMLKPVWVDRFLDNNVWDRADKLILSTATLPFRDKPEHWLQRIGLDPDTAKIISKPMPFPVEHRRVRLDYQIGNMSRGGVEDNWSEIVSTLSNLCEKHDGEKGIVHTVSYDRAEKLHETFSDNSIGHSQEDTADASTVINYWQNSDKQMLFTPSMTEGVDLEGDKCRWQVILKVPYRSTGDPRVDYLLNEEDDWDWYNDLAAREIIQAVGRAVRSKQDHATTYVFDEAFDRVMSGRMPQWFEDALIE